MKGLSELDSFNDRINTLETYDVGQNMAEITEKLVKASIAEILIPL